MRSVGHRLSLRFGYFFDDAEYISVGGLKCKRYGHFQNRDSKNDSIEKKTSLKQYNLGYWDIVRSMSMHLYISIQISVVEKVMRSDEKWTCPSLNLKRGIFFHLLQDDERYLKKNNGVCSSDLSQKKTTDTPQGC